MSNNGDSNLQYQSQNQLGNQYHKHTTTKSYHYQKYTPPSTQHQIHDKHQYQLPTYHHQANSKQSNHFKSINLLECGSWYYCTVITALIILIVLSSIILSRIPYDPPTIKIINYPTTSHANINEPLNEFNGEMSGAKLIGPDTYTADFKPLTKAINNIVFTTPIDPVCIFKSKQHHTNLPTTFSKDEVCDLLLNGELNIYAPSLDSSFSLYKIASVCEISDIGLIKVKKIENDMQKLIHSVLDKDNGPVVGICDKSNLMNFHKNGLIEPFTIDNSSCFFDIDDYLFNVVLNIE